MNSIWISVEDALPDEVQTYGRETANVYVRNSKSGFEGIAYMVRATDGNRWITLDGEFELHGITHWRNKH